MDRYIDFITNHWMLFVALCVVTFLLIQDLIESLLNKFESISPLMAVTKMNDESTVIIDVSEENEFASGHIENAVNAPFGNFDQHSDKLAPYKSSPVIVVCQTGARSASACKKLSKMGFENILNMTGGIRSWKENNLPIKITKKN